jgi:tetratricopeptide (TPR) repeat protein
MVKRRSEPSKELLHKVVFIAEAKTRLPLTERGHLNLWGVYCRVNSLPDGALFYQAGGKFIARLRFAVEKDGSIGVRKYQPGDWERKVGPTYDMAKYWMENIRVDNEIERLLADANEAEEKIQRLEKRASERPNEVNNWSALVPLYFDVARFKDAEKAAMKAVEAWPDQSASHYTLGRLYLIALGNTKTPRGAIALFGRRLEGLTVEALGYEYEQVRNLAQRHFEQALKLAAPKDSALQKAVENQFLNLRAIDETHYL